MMNIKVLGIDLAKNVFQLHGLDAKGKVVLKKQIKREQLHEFVSQLSPCLIGMEACGSAHYWARCFQAFGHEVKLMAPQFVKPYVKSNKNDCNDAEGIAEAVSRPNMRFVPIKSVEQQETLAIHRARTLLMKQRVSLANQIRGLLSEFGIIIAKSPSNIKKKLPEILEDGENELTPRLRALFQNLYDEFSAFEEKIKKYDLLIEMHAKEDVRCKRLMKIEGVGPITASVLVATVGNAKEFKNGREMAAWLGLVPKQRSSGNKNLLLGISKRGDRYIRTLLIHGGRSVTRRCDSKDEKRFQLVKSKKDRIGFNRTSVAVANTNARIIWAVLSKNEEYRKIA